MIVPRALRANYDRQPTGCGSSLAQCADDALEMEKPSLG
jgi:hypothetical protein